MSSIEEPMSDAKMATVKGTPYSIGGALWRILVPTLCALALGCGDGKKYERVSYNPPPIAGPLTAIAVPDSRGGVAPTEAPQIVFNEPLKRKSGIAFEGRFRPSDPKTNGGGPVHIHFKRKGDPLFYLASAVANFMADSDGWLTYRLEMRAPDSAEKCDVEIWILGELAVTGEAKIE